MVSSSSPGLVLWLVLAQEKILQIKRHHYLLVALKTLPLFAQHSAVDEQSLAPSLFSGLLHRVLMEVQKIQFSVRCLLMLCRYFGLIRVYCRGCLLRCFDRDLNILDFFPQFIISHLS
ncbi:hypothetical protein CHARACLAT_032186 [Characodon lateralis]|uniref:Uncharacterized protein n=1 Tax=Characodon lateralis TaxID=208331 RepID=A0ABU7EFC7_9TELE|nr:hypothetical protein [Characodon lateralis]